MGEIINWLRSDEIAIMTILQIASYSNIPKVFKNRPDMAQWVVSMDDGHQAVKTLSGSILGDIQEDSDFVADITFNNDLRDKTPDCNLIVDISDKNIGVMFRIYLTSFKRTVGGWE